MQRRRILGLFASLKTLCKRAQVGGCYFHGLVFACFCIKNTLFDDIDLPVAACGAQRVAAGVAERGLFAGFGASAGHELR